jgi:hypothetical protein
MKLTLTLAAVLALGSFAALAEETQAQPPVQMTTVEMAKMVAGADRVRLQTPIQLKLKLKDGTCVNK